MTKEYPLSPKSSLLELCNVLEHLRDDARDKAVPFAMYHAEHISEEKRAQAMYYMGQMRLCDQILWAAGGIAEKDGIENPTVCID